MFLIPALLGIVAQAVPSLLGLFAGPKAAAVSSKVIEVAQAVTGTATQEAAEAALKADPAKLEELRVRLAQVALDALRELDGDRANARAREIALRDHTPAILAGTVTAGFFGLLGAMLFCTLPPANEQILNILLGSLGTGWTMILAYYFGASAPTQGVVSRPLGAR